jgi:hypothetical protein
VGEAAIPVPTKLRRTGVAILRQKHEAFAVLIASGASCRVAAKSAGFSKDYGWDLMQRPAVKDKVEALRHLKTTAEPEAIASREWVEAQFVLTLERISRGGLNADAREDARLMLSGLMQFAKFKGWIVDRKQVASAKLDFGKVSRADLDAMLGQHLRALDPGARSQLERLAAGELAAADGESETPPL